MKCPYCHAEVGSGDLSCSECGNPLPRAHGEGRRIGMPHIVGIVVGVTISSMILGMTMVISACGVRSRSPQASATFTVIPTLTLAPTPSPVAAADAREPDDSIARARPITTDGTPQTHNLHAEGDRDYVLFDAQKGVGYTIETLHLGPDIDTVIYLYDGQENELARDDDCADETWASRILWIAPATGTYYVMIRDVGENSAGADATYSVRVMAEGAIEGDQYEPDDPIAQAKPIDTDGTYQTHTFHTSIDVDYVSFTPQQGVEYTIETGNLQGACDTMIYLCDEDGEELDYDDDTGKVHASRIVWSAPSSATYYVRIQEFTGRAGPHVSYEVWVSRPETPSRR